MDVYRLTKDKVTYNYRYFLPYAPEWGSNEFCRQRLKELLVFCKEAKVDAIQFFVNILPGTYYMPAHNAQEQLHWAKWMKTTVKPALEMIGVSYQLNFQMLLGVQSYGLDMRDDYEWDFLVNQHGDETLGCACPLSKRFRKTMGEMLELWASTNPDIIWIDDDFRMHNHGRPCGELDFYCYCDTHLDKFAEFTGKRYFREKLVAEILRPGIPAQLRLQWQKFLGDTMTETASWINKCIQNVSPKTRIALMTSIPDVHSAEGRNWKELLTSMSGEYKPMTRPMCGIYTGTSVPIKQNVCTYKYMSQSMTGMKRIFGNDGIEFGPELENTRFTTWCKSVANSRYVMIMAQLLGAPQITLSLNDLDGSPINQEPTTVPLLRDSKSELEALAVLNLREWQSQGVVFLDDEQSAAKVHLEEDAKMQDLGLIREWENILLQCGIPAYHASCVEAANGSDVVVLEAYTAWSPSDAELKEILSGPVLLDADAAYVVQERGFGEYLGINVGEREKFGCVSEKYKIGTINKTDLRIPYRGYKWRHVEIQGAEITSEYIDSQNNYHPASMIFTNKLGGRIAVYNNVGDLSPSGTFGNHARLNWLHCILQWLSQNKFSVLPQLSHHTLCIVRDNKNEHIIALANLGADMLSELKFQIYSKKSIVDVYLLNGDGQWLKADVEIKKNTLLDIYSMIIKDSLNVFEWSIIRLKQENTLK